MPITGHSSIHTPLVSISQAEEVKLLGIYLMNTLGFYENALYKFTFTYLPCLLFSLSLSLHFNGHFPGEPGLAGVY